MVKHKIPITGIFISTARGSDERIAMTAIVLCWGGVVSGEGQALDFWGGGVHRCRETILRSAVLKKLMLATALTMVPLAANAGTECRATMAAFQAIRSNMSYAQAVQVIGCPGEVISSSSIAGYITIMYMWDGNRFGANMNAMFQNDRLVNKAQFGLK